MDNLDIDLEDLVLEPITRIVTGGEGNVIIISTPVYELIIEPYIMDDGQQEGIEYTVNKFKEVTDA